MRLFEVEVALRLSGQLDEESGEEIEDAGERGGVILALSLLWCWNETFFRARTLAAWRVLFSR